MTSIVKLGAGSGVRLSTEPVPITRLHTSQHIACRLNDADNPLAVSSGGRRRREVGTDDSSSGAAAEAAGSALAHESSS